MTFQNIKDKAAQTLQDSGTVRTWTDTELGQYVNDGLRDFCTQVPILKKVVTLTENTGYDTDRQYSFWKMPTGTVMVNLYAVWNSGLPLDRTTIQDEYRNFAAWEDQQGTPKRYILGDYSQNNMRVVPYPTAALTALKAHVSYLDTALSAGTDVPTIPENWHNALADYAAMRAWVRGGEKEDAPHVQVLAALWQKAIAEAARLTASSFDRSPRETYTEQF